MQVLWQAYEQKNIRRRVYDALNVLMAMNIISKEKKEIKWIGLPTNSAQECQNLEVHYSPRSPSFHCVPESAGRVLLLPSCCLCPALAPGGHGWGLAVFLACFTRHLASGSAGVQQWVRACTILQSI
jgi:hypothetical protein